MTRETPQSAEYTECFVAFIDILGFSKLVDDSVDNTLLLATLTRALNAMAELPSGTKETRHRDAQGNMVERRWQVQVRPFSDSVVIFMPQEAGSLSQVLFMVRYLHDRMLELGLPLRGAVTLGGMYWHEAWSRTAARAQRENDDTLYERDRTQDLPITLGPGLIEAYELERDCAIYPRVLISRKLHEHARTQCLQSVPLGSYHQPDRALADFFRRDADGLYFLDLLHQDINRNDTERIVPTEGANGTFTVRWERDGSTHGTVMANVQSLIARWLDGHDLPEKTRAKYEWLRSYANQISGAQCEPGDR